MRKTANVCLLLTLLTGALIAGAQEVAKPQSPTATKTLYQRLGGYDALAAVVEDFLGRLGNDAQLKRFFIGLSTDSKRKVRNHTVDFLCIATGGPCLYTGRDMETVHTGLNITDSDWDVSVKHLVATLDKFKVPAQEKQEVLTAIGGLKSKIANR
jgi:hemoglobin